MKLPPLIALQGVFALHAVAIGLWFPRIPGVKAALGLDFTTLSIALLGIPIGVICGMSFAPRIVQAIGLRRGCIILPPLFGLMMIPPAFAPNMVILMMTLFAAGLVLSTVEVVINSAANAYQDASGRRIMSRCHAFWSLGVMGGSLIGGTLADAGMAFTTQQLLMEPLFAVLAGLIALSVPDDIHSDAPKKSTAFQMPSIWLAALCVMPIGALMIEGAMFDWSVLFAETELGASTFIGSTVLSTFALSMAFGRYVGDWITDRFGELRVIVVSCTALGLGIALFGLSTSLWVAFPAALIVGFGSANPYPIAMSLARFASDRAVEANIAFIAIVSFTAFLIGPPLIGFIAAAFGLPIALTALAPLGLASVLLVYLGLIRTQAPD